MIVAAAMMIDGEVKALPAPARHHDIIGRWPMPEHHHGTQGFIDSKEGFVDRFRACLIAIIEGQIEMPKATSPQNELFSEDLW
ncbi:hypothetical protein [Thalassospira tepidiphila]|uniref:Uncharacterized protein n=2 Tax=Thalassospira tepidiphila TaxID=393657 RepID=A0A853KVS7_9PROT|nr:hypothetical protein [Thalassospira tepidiphila]NJB74579.1 hypothetical protein [Thalassospira tepidiphila]OAZ08085.1 hypothetical protein TH4_18740 [Thalassospira tepidiphila MCCC 1A03514]